MSRPYKVRGRFYEVGSVQRPNKTAAGMMATKERSRHEFSNDALQLAVRGTTDKLGGIGIYWNTERSKRICKCCGQRVNARVLNDRGRSKLRIKREMRERGLVAK